MVAASSPAMPQEIPMGGEDNGLCWWPGGVLQNVGSIISSYATGNPDGGSADDEVSGLVGRQYDGTIISSYATGNPEGESGDDEVSGLVGRQHGSTITSSYATGNPNGDDG